MRRNGVGRRIALAICWLAVSQAGVTAALAETVAEPSVAKARVKQDIALMKTMGFDHVRRSVNPQPMWQHNEADEMPAEYLGYLDAAVKMILEKNLAG